MDYSKEIWIEEKGYLQATLEMIKEQIEACSDKAENYKDNIVKAQKGMWEERSMQADPSKEVDGAIIAWQHQSYMINEAKSMTFFSQMGINLQRMESAPYFARIDFDEEEFGEDFNLRRNEVLGQLQKSLMEEVQSFARSQSYDLIVGEGVLFASDSVDVTAQILSGLESRFNASN